LQKINNNRNAPIFFMMSKLNRKLQQNKDLATKVEVVFYFPFCSICHFPPNTLLSLYLNWCKKTKRLCRSVIAT
jgi:hypothetical protein